MNKKLGIITVLFMAITLMAIPFCSAMTITSPQSINKGDTFKINIKAGVGQTFIKGERINAEFKYISTETSYIVFWDYTYVIADDKLSIVVTINTDKNISTGTYNINFNSNVIRNDTYFLGHVTLYVSGHEINWMVLFSLIFVGIFFIAMLGLGWGYVKKTKTKGDDVALIFVGIAGIGLILLGIAYYFGYWVI